MTGVSIPRLRRVRFKDGRTIDVLRRNADSDMCARFRRSVDRILAVERDHPMEAFAVLVWDGNGYVLVDYLIGDKSKMLACSLPQLAKDTLLAEQAIRWTE